VRRSADFRREEFALANVFWSVQQFVEYGEQRFRLGKLGIRLRASLGTGRGVLILYKPVNVCSRGANRLPAVTCKEIPRIIAPSLFVSGQSVRIPMRASPPWDHVVPNVRNHVGRPEEHTPCDPCLVNQSWIQNRIQLAPATPNMPTKEESSQSQNQ
jgi:hypothetical protein